MNSIDKVKSISVWIFIIPFISVNTCLLIVTNFHQVLEPGIPIFPTFPYFDGGVSISRTVRDFPLYLIFKPAMFMTSYLLIRYWLNTKNIINYDLIKTMKKNCIIINAARGGIVNEIDLANIKNIKVIF